ncbi:MAG TPA: MFS transporter [Pirellulales bacterium]|nr:MFS transporter [Pirellulales bacterium]
MAAVVHDRALPSTIETDVPARLDRLPWGRFHWLVLAALGITWILDGLEVTLMGSISGVLEDADTLAFSSKQIGLIGSCYVAGMVGGSLVFGYLTDRWGRKLLFFITLAIYLGGTLLTAFSWNATSFALFRLLTGAGIGGEYSAINSAIDELIPARRRGWVDLLVNGSYWLGAALGSLSTLLILNPRLLHVDLGWRVGFAVGAIVGLGILLLRNWVPESPRWLVLHGYPHQAEQVVSEIEREIEQQTGETLARPQTTITIHPHRSFGFRRIMRAMLGQYRQRSLLGLTLMVAQAFLYNAIFLTYALVLKQFYDVPGEQTGLYLLPFAVGNFLGVVCLGHWFDSIGRRRMITLTYALAGTLLAVTAVLFQQRLLSATSQTALWSVIFFFASAASSAAYLTVSETFPLEIRGLAIALFFSIGTGVGGVIAPTFFGILVGTESREWLLLGYLIAAGLMLAAAAVEWSIGIDAERKSLEEIAEPLAAEE